MSPFVTEYCCVDLTHSPRINNAKVHVLDIMQPSARHRRVVCTPFPAAGGVQITRESSPATVGLNRIIQDDPVTPLEAASMIGGQRRRNDSKGQGIVEVRGINPLSETPL
jgi:hypothetical protein